MGRAINKTGKLNHESSKHRNSHCLVTIAEILKRRVPKLHQTTQIESTDITDVYEPLEEGLDRYHPDFSIY